jgi:ABC-type Fe3+ transport system substrate-binding protein
MTRSFLGRRHPQRHRHLCGALLVLSLSCAAAATLADESKTANELRVFAAPSARLATLRIHGTADTPAIGPVIAQFQVANPNVEIDYQLFETVPLYQRAASVPSPAPLPDVLISSATNLQIKLGNDGRLRHTAVDTGDLPDWASWRGEVFAFTREPAVIVYNRRTLRPDEIPHSHQDLVQLLERSSGRFKGRIATYDIDASGVGYLFATTESTLSANFWRLAHALGVAHTRLFCCSQDMIDSLIRGETAIAYNVLGSYALQHVRQHPDLQIVLPSDYVVVVTRTLAIPKEAPQPELAERFVSFVLSPPGQAAVAESFGLAVANSSDREEIRAHYANDRPGVFNIPALTLSALAYLDSIKRDQFIRTWRQIVAPRSSSTGYEKDVVDE